MTEKTDNAAGQTIIASADTLSDSPMPGAATPMAGGAEDSDARAEISVGPSVAPSVDLGVVETSAPSGPPRAERPVPPPIAAAEPPARTPVTRQDLLPLLSAIGFVLLVAGLIVVWLNPFEPAQVRDANQRIASLDARLRQLEARPVPAPQSVTGDIAKLTARVEVLESRQNADPAQVAQRLDVMAGRIEGLTNRVQALQDGANQSVDALSARVTRLETAENSAAAIATKLDKVARLQDAAIALAEGRPVGDLPGAPPALAKFAKAAPPTEAMLRLAFPAAERAALAAEQPDLTGMPFWRRVLEKAQALVTVRRGKDVVVGNRSAVALAAAKAALDAGDLAKAVAALNGLADAPKTAMAPWMAEAQSLLAARAALASMAGQA